MRQSSALFDRLDRRFARMENIGQSPFRGYERLDRFIRNFQERMKRLESMGKFREMALFKRIPSFASNDPWGSMGGWSFAKDLVYLEGIPQEEEMIEEVEAPKVSPWGTADRASGNKDLRVDSPWLNTPYRAARVSKGNRVAGVASSARRAPPLQRLLNKAAVSEFYADDKKQVQESLPPMLSRSPRIAEKLIKENERASAHSGFKPSRRQAKERFTPQVSSARKMRTPKSAIEQLEKRSRISSSQNRIQSDLPSVNDYQVLVQQLVQEIQDPKNMDKVSVQKLKKRVQKVKKEIQKIDRKTPLQSVLEREEQFLNIKENSFGRDSILPSAKNAKRNNFSREKEVIVTSLVAKIEKLSTSGDVSEDKLAEIIQKHVRVADKKIRKLQVEPSVRNKAKNVSSDLTNIVLSSLSPEAFDKVQAVEEKKDSPWFARSNENVGNKIATALDSSRSKRSQIVELVERLERIEQVSERSVLPKLFQREASIERKVVTELVSKIEKLGSSANLSDDKLAESIEQHVQIANQKIKKLQSQRKNKTAFMDMIDIQPDSMEEQESQIEEASESTDSPWFSRQDVEEKISSATKGRIARPQIIELVERLEKVHERAVKKSSRGVLPKFLEREASIERKVVTELVSKIEKLGSSANLSDDKLAESIEQHVQIANQKIKKLQSQRKNKTAFMDMIDIQPDSMEEQESQIEEASESTDSPWFSRRDESKNVEKQQKLSATQQAASRMLKENTLNPTRPEVIAKSFGLTKKHAEQVVSAIQSGRGLAAFETKDSSQKRFSQPSLLSYVEKRSERKTERSSEEKGISLASAQGERAKNRPSSLLGALERATAPIHLPEWRSVGTEGRDPLSSGRSWRLESRRRAMYPSSALQETFLDPSISSPEEASEQQIQASERKSPWFSGKNHDDFESEALKGVPDLSSVSRLRSKAKKFGNAKSVQFDSASISKKSATWLEPNRTVLLDNGVVIDAKQASLMGIKPQKKSTGNLPLQWTLEGLQLESNNSALPGWAKRASGKPQYKNKSVDQEFVSQVTQASSLEGVVEAILDRSKKEFVGNATLAKSTVQAIERIRKESHRALETKLVAGISSKQRRSAKHRALSFTGLKPLSVGQASQRDESPDKISKLAKQLENLVLLAEDNQRDEARQGVRMAEDSHAAVAEGKAVAGRDDERDASIDIDALAQEVLFAFEQELSLRKMRSFDESSNPDVWW